MAGRGVARLALLPNGEAVQPGDVQRILIEPFAGYIEEEGERFAVWLHLADGERRLLGSGLSRADATDLSRRSVRVINEALGDGT
jgi:hypothetical protein